MIGNRGRALALAASAALLVAACGPTAPTATPSGEPSARPTTAPTAAATPGPSPDATAAATPTAAAELDPVLGAFAARVEDPALSYRLRQTGTLATSATTMDFAYDVQIAGADFSAVMTIDGETTELMGVDGTGYLKAPDGSWSSFAVTEEMVADIVDPWQYLGPLAGLRPDGPAASPEGALAFVNGEPIDYQTGTMRDQGIVGAIRTLSFTVLPDGTPVAIAFEAESPDGQGGTLSITSTVEISEFGEPATIEAPLS